MAAEMAPNWHCWACRDQQPVVGDRVEILDNTWHWRRGEVVRVIDGGGETTTDYVIHLDIGINISVFGCDSVHRLGVLDLLAELG